MMINYITQIFYYKEKDIGQSNIFHLFINFTYVHSEKVYELSGDHY